MLAAAPRTHEAALFVRLLRGFYTLEVHRLAPCNVDSLIRGRGAGGASVPKRTAPWIDAATAEPTRQSSQ